jgi:hypothetical protein
VPFYPGEIVYARFSDPDGNPCVDAHPAIVLKAKQETAMLLIVGITGSHLEPFRDYWVEMPWHPDGHPVTGFNKRCAAKGNWVVPIPMAQVQPTGRILPPSVIEKVADAVDKVIRLKQMGKL